jgi:hypothetical protein
VVTVTLLTDDALTTDDDYDGIDPTDLEVSTTDDDTAGVTVTDTTGLRTTERGGTATFTVVLDSEPSGNVVVHLASLDVAEGVISSSADLTFTGTPAGNWAAPQTVTLTGVPDAVEDGDVAYTVELTIDQPATADPGYHGIDPADVVATNEDVDDAGVWVDPTAGLETTEPGGMATFTVVLDAPPSGAVVIDVASDTPAEGVAAPAQLTFGAEDWSVAQEVTVTGVQGGLAGDQPYLVELTMNAAGTSAAEYELIDPDDVSVTNLGDPLQGTYFTLVPCRVLDTRASGPALTSAQPRVVSFHGTCGVPATAVAVSINVTVTQPTHPGFVTGYPADLVPPSASTLNFASGQNRANNAILRLATDGAGTLAFAVAWTDPGEVHLIVDVNGYFE